LTYSIVLLLIVVHIAVKDLDEELDGHRGVHTSIGYTQRSL
jgi:hypothetical protein